MKAPSRLRTASSRAPLGTPRRLFVSLAFALLALFFALTPKLEQSAHASDRVVLAVVVAKSSIVQDLSLAELRRIFTNEGDSDSSGQRYVPFNHPPHTPDRVGFDQRVLGMSEDDVSQFWIERKIRGLPGPPRSVDSLSLLLRLIGRLPGGIGYARPAQLTPDVRAVRVNGKLPNEADYPLIFSE
ncbi:MAG TPA: hypothetical protein VHV51_00210 [Polyangiaceae bacterium]|jgi:hypothetical protein|nr:hypothetical protein [Polyangiaceae bacterium]